MSETAAPGRAPWVWVTAVTSVLGVGLAILGFALWQTATGFLAYSSYELAAAAYDERATQFEVRAEELVSVENALASANTLNDADFEPYLPAEEASQVADSLTEVNDDVLALTDVSVDVGLGKAPTQPATDHTWPWDRLASAAEWAEARDQDLQAARDFEAQADALDSIETQLVSSAEGVLEVLPKYADARADETPSATFRTVIAVREAAENATAADTNYPDAVRGALDRYAASLDAMQQSHAEKEAEKSDPSYPVRAEIEEYARSISNGVTLDFVWAEVVNGLGEGWYSGTAESYSEYGGWSTISLNYEILEGWVDGDVNAKAIVAHEVGHAQEIRPECFDAFWSETFNRDSETWATAWAISMGFDVDGSGISAYGRPTEKQIQLAATCR